MNYEGHDIYSRSFNVKDGQTANIFRFVVQDGKGGVRNAKAADADKVIGVCMDNYNALGRLGVVNWMPDRQGVRVRVIGSANVEAAEALTYGDQVSVNDEGKAIKATGTTGVIGECFTEAKAPGELVLVFLKVLG